MERPTVLIPAPVLAQPAAGVTDIDEAVRAVCRDLVDTMRAAGHSVGVAAPQIGVGIRAFCIDVTGHPKARSCHGEVVLVNPEVVLAHGREIGREGCMSVPDLTGDVARHTLLVVRGTTPDGRERVLECDAFEARAVQHELDHLDGLVFLDRVVAADRVFVVAATDRTTLRGVPFPRKLLNENEEIVLDLHPHWLALLKPIAAVIAAIVLGVLVLTYLDNDPVSIGSGVIVLVALVFFGIEYGQWVTTNFVVTTDRLIYRHGLVSKHGIEIPLERVNTVFSSQNLFERMVRSGDLVIESAGEQGRQEFSDVRRPMAVQNEIYKQMEANENRKYDRMGAVASGGGGGLSIPEQLERLDELRKSGALSEEEYQQSKARLLEKM